MRLGPYIRERRLAAGMTLADVAGMVANGNNGSISISYLHDVEHGRRWMHNHAMLRQLADALSCSYDYLCFIEGLLPDDMRALTDDPQRIQRAFMELRAMLHEVDAATAGGLGR